MFRTDIAKKILDSSASPYIEQKNVILCRSGKQVYRACELASFITEDNKPPVAKDIYVEFRPANVVVKAKKLFRNLPVTKEHPEDWVTPNNWRKLCGGTTGKEVDIVALDGESEGEIGIKTDVTFYDSDLYSYYADNNREVSVGYTCRKHFVPNPEEVGYDIVLDEIMEVNHLAITRMGRGGSSVAVIDSISGGKPMAKKTRTGIFSWLKFGKQTDSVAEPFSKTVLDAVRNSAATTDEELEKEISGVIDSLSDIMDCEKKTTLVDVVRDCFDNKDKALENAEGITEAIDSLYNAAVQDSVDNIANGLAKDSEGNPAEDSTQDSAKPEDGEAHDGCNCEGEKPEEGETQDGCEKGDEKPEDKTEDSNVNDSAVLTKEDVAKIVNDSFASIIDEKIKEALGVSNTAGHEPEGSVIDSVTHGSYDYESFLDK